MANVEKLYDLLASWIQEFISAGTDIRRIRTASSERKKTVSCALEKDLGLIDDSLCRDEEFLLKREDPLYLATMISQLDEKLHQEMEHQNDRDCLELEDVKEIAGLNSLESQQRTNILLIPRYPCIWEGRNRDDAHCQDVNTILRHSYAVILKDGKVGGRYKVRNYVLDAGLYGVCSDEQNEQRISILTSPVSGRLEEIKNPRTYTENGQNYFGIAEFAKETEDNMIETVKQVIQRADANKNELIVFPEMLGTKRMQQEIMDMLQALSLDYTKCICMPSIWDKSTKIHENRNFCALLSFSGEELFTQDKLKKYLWKKPGTEEEYEEDILEGDTIHLIHNRGYGSIAVLI